MIFCKTENVMFAIASVNSFCSKGHIHVYSAMSELILYPSFPIKERITSNRA